MPQQKDEWQPLAMVEAGGVPLSERASALRRLNFFDGKFLRAQDFQLEQLYHRRSLAFGNHAGGWGVVEGFCVSLGQGSRDLVVEPGLAIDPAGWGLYLGAEKRVSLLDVLAGPQAETASSPTFTRGTSIGFEACDSPLTPPTTTSGQGMTGYWVIRITQDERLCGHEDVYGGICSDACVTAFERPHSDEGVRVFAQLVSLTLPTSKNVGLTELHRRSRAASAYFNAETPDPSHLISGPGILSDAWCCCARPIGGPGVPLALIYWNGTSAQFLDTWIARRERMETPPKRYWALGMRMRPWDIFLAQVLQFQCQLPGVLGGGAPGGPGAPNADPCVDVRATLFQAHEYVTRLRTMVNELADARAYRFPIPGGLTDLDALLAQIKKGALQEVAPKGADRILVDGGIIELPPAGYLPINLEGGSVNKQVRALLGPGVDLRYAVVTPDYVAHALEEAQHMDRISLLQGIDDPNNKPKVDILVPDGEIRSSEAVVKGTAFETALRFSQRDGDTAASEGVGRFELDNQGGGNFYYAGGVATRKPTTDTGDTNVFEWTSVGAYAGKVLKQYAARSSEDTKARRVELINEAPSKEVIEENIKLVSDRLEPYRPKDVDLDRLGGVWIEAQCGNPLALSVGGSTHFSATLDRGLDHFRQAVAEYSVSGDFKVYSVIPSPHADRVVFGHIPLLTATEKVNAGTPHTWHIHEARAIVAWSSTKRLLIAMLTDPKTKRVFIGEARATAAHPMKLTIRFASVPQEPGRDFLNLGLSFNFNQKLTPEALFDLFANDADYLGRALLRENEAVLTPGTDPRNTAESAIDFLSAYMAAVRAEQNFREYARGKLFGEDPNEKKNAIVLPHRDWVLFHKRREWKLAETVEDAPLRKPARYSMYLVHIEDLESFNLSAIFKLWRSTNPLEKEKGRSLLDFVFSKSTRLGFEDYGWHDTHLLFPGNIPNDLGPANPGNQLERAAIATFGEEDEPFEQGRLLQLFGAFPQGIDTSNAIPEVLEDVPPQFADPGADGFILLATRNIDVIVDRRHLVFGTKSLEATNYQDFERATRFALSNNRLEFEKIARLISVGTFEGNTQNLRNVEKKAGSEVQRTRWVSFVKDDAQVEPAKAEAKAIEAKLENQAGLPDAAYDSTKRDLSSFASYEPFATLSLVFQPPKAGLNNFRFNVYTNNVARPVGDPIPVESIKELAGPAGDPVVDALEGKKYARAVIFDRGGGDPAELEVRRKALEKSLRAQKIIPANGKVTIGHDDETKHLKISMTKLFSHETADTKVTSVVVLLPG